MSAPERTPQLRLILGLMNFGPSEADGARITDLDTFGDVLDLFQKKGYHEVDTARVYVGGTQEAFTRAVDWRKRGLHLATKVHSPSAKGDNAAVKVVASVDKSLEELGTDTVDVLYLHRPDRTVPFDETLKAIDELHKSGKFKKFGLSNFAAFEVAEVVMICKQRGWICPTVYQGRYNFLLRNVEPDIFNVCRRYGLDFVAYNPIAGGLLSDQVKNKDHVPDSGRYSNTSPAIGSAYRSRYLRDDIFESIATVRRALERHNLNMIDVALRWLVHHSDLRIDDGNDGIILGVSSVRQLDQNVCSLESGPLPEDVVAALDHAWEVSAKGQATGMKRDITYTYTF